MDDILVPRREIIIIDMDYITGKAESSLRTWSKSIFWSCRNCPKVIAGFYIHFLQILTIYI
ncbi:hypothetical protein TREAZ_0044 [Leadbettera azotonutricia ZAS-9]|uniref:Uncharacterized protein n=1 Tax=Leadbettera azotonutricia (strain ATCC BAA-888 / DSM 13862 / ZAS-9) TaxID=545695 RepID=F5YG36_LEAAZ|nr:hypothetical protein TREAZ_0044 [Leadbettera azotonutricia ZAS-9]